MPAFAVSSRRGQFYGLQEKGFKNFKGFVSKDSEWSWYYNYDRSHDGLGGKSPAQALQQVNPGLPKDTFFLPPSS